MIILTAPTILLWIVGAQFTVVDLTNAPVARPQWKIVSSQTGGSIGSSMRRPAQPSVAMRLAGCSERDSAFYFSLEIENNGQSEIQIPVGLDSRPFDRRESVTFKELLISLGETEGDDGSFRSNPAFDPITLFGNPAVRGTIRVLPPGQGLILRLKTEMRGGARDVAKLRAQIAASDVALSPSAAGYEESRTWTPALFASSQPTCSAPERETK